MIQYYEIRIKGHLDPSWSDWFDGMTIIHEDNSETLLVGTVADQAALHGLLTRVRDLGLQLISVNPVEARRVTMGSVPISNDDDQDKTNTS